MWMEPLRSTFQFTYNYANLNGKKNYYEYEFSGQASTEPKDKYKIFPLITNPSLAPVLTILYNI